MFILLLLAMTLLPFIEFTLIIRVYQQMTAYMGGDSALFLSLGIVILTGLLGAKLAKSQGFSIARQLQQSLAQGRIPTTELAEGFLVLVGGVLLFAPGYLTDIIGLSFLIPMTRPFIARGLMKFMAKQNIKTNIHIKTYGHGQSNRHPSQQKPRHEVDGDIIDIVPESERS